MHSKTRQEGDKTTTTPTTLEPLLPNLGTQSHRVKFLSKLRRFKVLSIINLHLPQLVLFSRRRSIILVSNHYVSCRQNRCRASGSAQLQTLLSTLRGERALNARGTPSSTCRKQLLHAHARLKGAN